MLTRQHRFHGYNSLRKIYPRTKTVRGSLISLRYHQRDAGRPYRVAVVVAKRVHKLAVKRNRIRRRIYEIVRQSENIPPSTDLIFSVYSDRVADIGADELKEQIEGLLTKVAK